MNDADPAPDSPSRPPRPPAANAGGYYESDRGLAEYLLFHYGNAEQTIPFPGGPRDAVDYPARCVRECLDVAAVPAPARGLDLGCAVGGSSFEMARYCAEVIGIDLSHRFINSAREMQKEGRAEVEICEEGEVRTNVELAVPGDIDRTRVTFQQGDAEDLTRDLGLFDIVLLGNLIDRLRCPVRCLRQLAGLLRPGGQLIITSPYTWLPEYTPREEWLGGFYVQDLPHGTIEGLRELLRGDFDFQGARDLPFVLREHARKYQWSVAQGSMWRRR